MVSIWGRAARAEGPSFEREREREREPAGGRAPKARARGQGNGVLRQEEMRFPRVFLFYSKVAIFHATPENVKIKTPLLLYSLYHFNLLRLSLRRFLGKALGKGCPDSYEAKTETANAHSVESNS